MSNPFERIWARHVVAPFDDERSLVHIDRHFLQETSCMAAFDGLRRSGRRVRRPDLTLAVIDHSISTAPGRTLATWEPARARCEAMIHHCAEFDLKLFQPGDHWQGIVHVVAPELGFALPGLSYVCGDSHTASCGGLGAWAWGIGTTEVEQVLASQCLVQKKPSATKVEFRGRPRAGISPKDMILALIARYGVAAGTGSVLQYTGPAIDAMTIEGRMTICNMSIEIGARSGFICADDTTFEYLHGKPLAPREAMWDRAVADWRALFADRESSYERTLTLDCAELQPQVSWGTSPGQVIGVDETIPEPAGDAEQRAAMAKALGYMDLVPGQPIAGTPVDIAFIGSCTNGRLSDLVAAADVLRGRKVAQGVRAMAVPGAQHVKEQAEAMGLDRVFRDAGFEWREPGCSMCVAAGGDIVPPGKRSISTTNRNFEGRQGPASRTHLASPAMVAAAAVTGRITDVRRLVDGVPA